MIENYDAYKLDNPTRYETPEDERVPSDHAQVVAYLKDRNALAIAHADLSLFRDRHQNAHRFPPENPVQEERKRLIRALSDAELRFNESADALSFVFESQRERFAYVHDGQVVFWKPDGTPFGHDIGVMDVEIVDEDAVYKENNQL